MTELFPPLPYDVRDLEPVMLSETIERHRLLQRQYVDTVQQLAPQAKTLDDVLLLTSRRYNVTPALKNAAAQTYAHALFWKCLRPYYTQQNMGPTLRALLGAGNKEILLDWIVQEAAKVVGSGWLWFTINSSGMLDIEITSPTGVSINPVLFVLDLWEHAFIDDYLGKRELYVHNVLRYLINWDRMEVVLRANR